MAVSYEIKVYTTWEIEKCNFQYTFFNCFFSVILRPNYTQFCTHVVEGHLEGTVSQIFYLSTRSPNNKVRKIMVKKKSWFKK